MYYVTFKLKERKMSAIERLIAVIEQEIITNKNKNKKKAKNNEGTLCCR